MPDPHSQPFRQATVTQAAETWPDLHPARAAMRALAGPRSPALTVSELRARRDAELAFFGATPEGRARFPALDILARGVHRRFDHRIAEAERREAREAQLARIDISLAEAQARLERALGRSAA